jgi:hypothetical protein
MYNLDVNTHQKHENQILSREHEYLLVIRHFVSPPSQQKES